MASSTMTAAAVAPTASTAAIEIAEIHGRFLST
jgi:hypothetical protein